MSVSPIRTTNTLIHPVSFDGQEKELPSIARIAKAVIGSGADGRTTDSVRALTSAVARGEEDAFRRLYDLYHGRVFRLSLVLTRGDEALACEAVQSVMLAAARKLKPLSEEAHLWNWLARVTRQQLAKSWRRQKRDRSLFEPMDQASDLGVVDPDDVIEKHLDAVLRLLDRRDGELIEWYYFEKQSQKQIAEHLGSTPKAVCSRLERLRTQLRTLLLRRLSDET